MAAEKTLGEREAERAYVREFLPALVGYGVVLLVVIVAVDFETAGGWKYAVALLPIIPALLGVWAIARHVRRIDEMHRGIQLQGMAAGFASAMACAMTIGFLALAGLDTGGWGPWLVYAVGMLAWLLTVTGASRARA